MLKIEVKNQNAKQFQLEYAMYMMLGSYFKKATCKSKIIEKRLFLYYQDLGCSKQEDLEEEVIKFIDETLLFALDIPGIEERKVSIRFIPTEKGNIINIEGKNVYINLKVCKKNGRIKYAFLKTPNPNASVKWLPEDKKKEKRVWKHSKKTARVA